MTNTWRNMAIALAVILAIGVGIGAGYAIWGGSPQTVSTESLPSGDFPIIDSFTLPPFDEEGLESKYTSWPPSHQYPFNEYGLYISSPFFLNTNEVIDITIKSNLPIGFENMPQAGPEHVGGLFANLVVINGGSASFESFELKRSSNSWVARAVFSVSSAGGPYHLIMTNDSGLPRYSPTGVGIPAWCQYAIFLR